MPLDCNDIGLGIPKAPYASYVYFMDGMSHYTDPNHKWHTVSGTVDTVAGTGTWFDLESTDGEEEYPAPQIADNGWGYRGRSLRFQGEYSPGDTLPYVQMDLAHLRRQKVHVSFNIKADSFTGVPFLQLLDEDEALIFAYAFTPEGIPHSMQGTLYTNYRFALGGAQYTLPGHWINLKCGIGFVINEAEIDSPISQGMGAVFRTERSRSVDGWGCFHPFDPTDVNVRYVRIGSAGGTTLYNDIICLSGTGMINEANCIHTLVPIEPKVSFWDSVDVFFGGVDHSGESDTVDDFPPSTGSSLSFGETCESFTFKFVDIDSEEDIEEVKDEFFGTEFQSYGTIQVSALSTGVGGVMGILASRADSDSNFLPHPAPRSAWKTDMTQVCHCHHFMRYLWKTAGWNSLNAQWLKTRNVDIPTYTTEAP